MKKRMLRILMVLAAGYAFIAGPAARGQCGPGAHWVDSCPGGQDNFPNTTGIGAIDITFDCGTDATIPVAGVAVIQHADPSDDSQNYPGTRPVDGHLDVIDTEILSMSLTGGGGIIVAGEGQGQGGVLPASPGVIAEDQSDPTLAESFFDCYFEAYVAGVYVYNHDPIRLQASIDRFPPFGQSFSFSGCVPVYDSPYPGQGNQLGNIISIEFTIQQPTDIPTLSEWGASIMCLLILLVGTIAVVRRNRKPLRTNA